MEGSNVLQVLLYFIPAALVLMSCYLLLKQFLANETKLKIMEIKKAHQKDLLPLRISAYERVVLFLERISPNNLIIRVNKPGMSAKELQNELIATIRSEYEHNLTQQIFISAPVWEAVRNAKEDMIKLISVAMTQMTEKNVSMDLTRSIFELILNNENMPTQKAIDLVKKEARHLYL